MRVLLSAYPDLAPLPDEALRPLVCTACAGAGGRTDEAGRTIACRICEGSRLGCGLCPTCHGAAWVRDERFPVGHPARLQRCPDCRTEGQRAVQIDLYVDAQFAALATTAPIQDVAA